MGTIQSRLRRKVYKTTAECLRDFQLMFSNCYTYNKPDTDITLMCQAIERTYHQRLAAMPQEVGTLCEALCNQYSGIAHNSCGSMKCCCVAIAQVIVNIIVVIKP